jgi:hypothetical protein
MSEQAKLQTVCKTFYKITQKQPVQDIPENYKFWPFNSTTEILIQHWLGKVEKNGKKIITLDSSYSGCSKYI